VKRQTIQTSGAPAAIGPYSQAVVVQGGRTLYTSGQIPLDPETGDLVGGSNVAVQARQVLDNLDAVLREANMGWDDVVRVGIFLTDLGDFTIVNGIYAERFAGDPPARATVQVAALPKGVAVEIDLIAVAD
jgi:2-iminobutanoate/2-iminopropanoate deaminase